MLDEMRKSKRARTMSISISHKSKNDVLLTLVNDCNCALNVNEVAPYSEDGIAKEENIELEVYC